MHFFWRKRLGVLALVFGVCAVLPARAQTLSNSKLSAHLINGYTVGSSSIVAGKPRVLKVLALDSGFPSGLVQAMRDYKAKAPGGKVVVRVYSPKNYSLANDPTASALDFWNTVIQPPLNGISASDRALIDYLEGPNEGETPTLGYPSSPQGSQWFNQFWTNLTPLIVAAGYKPCVGSIAVGNPGSFSDLDPFVPALRQAKAAGGAWSYHAYTIQYSTDVGVEVWYSLRYRQFYSYFAQQGYSDLLNLPLILTEGGVDATGDPSTSGWQARGTAVQYERWLNWFDGQMSQDSYLLGCTLFENGDSSGWSSFELEPIAGWMKTYLTNPTTWPPPPTGVTAVVSAGSVVLAWTNAPLNPVTYAVKRSLTSGGALHPPGPRDYRRHAGDHLHQRQPRFQRHQLLRGHRPQCRRGERQFGRGSGRRWAIANTSGRTVRPQRNGRLREYHAELVFARQCRQLQVAAFDHQRQRLHRHRQQRPRSAFSGYVLHGGHALTITSSPPSTTWVRARSPTRPQPRPPALCRTSW